MADRLPDSPVDRLRSLLAAATETPWFHGDNDGWGHGRGWHVWAASPDVADGDEQFVAFTGRLTERWSPQDAALIAEGISLLPKLLDVVEAAARLHPAAVALPDGTYVGDFFTGNLDADYLVNRDAVLELIDSTVGAALAALEAGAGQEEAG